MGVRVVVVVAVPVDESFVSTIRVISYPSFFLEFLVTTIVA